MTNNGVVLPHGDCKWIVIVVAFTEGGLIFEGKCIFENKPPPQSRSCLLLKKGGAYFREDAVLYSATALISVQIDALPRMQMQHVEYVIYRALVL